MPNSITTEGEQLQIYTCDGRPNQAWTYTSSGQLIVTLGDTIRCLDSNNQGTTPGAKAVTWECTGQPNQQWSLRPDRTVVSLRSGLCLDVANSSTANSARNVMSPCDGRSSQQWALTS